MNTRAIALAILMSGSMACAGATFVEAGDSSVTPNTKIVHIPDPEVEMDPSRITVLQRDFQAGRDRF